MIRSTYGAKKDAPSEKEILQRLPNIPWSFWRGLIILLALGLLAGQAQATDEKSIRKFTEAMVALGPGVDPAEAQLVSETSHFTARRLQTEWNVAGLSIVQNFLVHFGKRERGYCFHWAHGIGAELRKLPLKTLVLYWAEAHPGTRLEHNVIVVTAPQQPLRSGYIIDGWRSSGRLLWFPVAKDEYPWKENAIQTAWMQNRGPDGLWKLDAPAQGQTSRTKANQKAAGAL